MVSVFAHIYRGKIIESKHEAICLVKNSSKKIILSTKGINNFIYPRSAIKIFQAFPFINSKAHKLFNLNQKIIAVACSSHAGEPQHLQILNLWLKKINISENKLLCGIHNPLNEKYSNKLLLSGNLPNQLHNNCSGKHLAMISGCLANKIDIDRYIDFKHPYQKMIRQTLETFMESKIQKQCIAIDGCNAPQYAFSLKNIVNSMINLIKERQLKNKYSQTINTIIQSINNYPDLIGGYKQFDSDVIRVTKGKIFCKRGAEGVLLFANFSKKIGGAIKIIDGNNRAVPPIAMQIFANFKMLSSKESEQLSHWKKIKILNHAKKNIGSVSAKIV